MFSVAEMIGELSSSITNLDGSKEVGIGFDLGGQHVVHDLDRIVAVQQIGCFAVGHMERRMNGVQGVPK